MPGLGIAYYSHCHEVKPILIQGVFGVSPQGLSSRSKTIKTKRESVYTQGVFEV